MKLCRFELKDDPGNVRSGMVFSGKIYETNGGEAVGVHEADQVRPLAPIRQAPSLRIFRNDFQDADGLDPRFFYANPSNLLGASHVLSVPDTFTEFSFLPMIAAVVVSDAHRLEVMDADDIVLGITLMNLLVSADQERADRRAGVVGLSHDFGGVIGPVITTPEELDDQVSDDVNGRKYSLTAVARVNGVEVGRGQISDLPFSFAQAISFASQCVPVREGDIFAFGPIVDFIEPAPIGGGDEVQIAVEKLGTLSFKLAQEII